MEPERRAATAESRFEDEPENEVALCSIDDVEGALACLDDREEDGWPNGSDWTESIDLRADKRLCAAAAKPASDPVGVVGLSNGDSTPRSSI